MYRYPEPSLSDVIIAFLTSARSTRLFHQILRERTLARYKRKTIQVALSRLQQRGLIERNDQRWGITKKGVMAGHQKMLFDFIMIPKNGKISTKTIVAFDIPETHRRERVWLRNQLKIFGYTMLQRSLWAGPGPLPSEFFERLKNLGIFTGVKTFTVVNKK